MCFAAIAMRRLLSIAENPPIQEFIDTNLIPLFIRFIEHTDFPKLQFEAAWSLTNIASGLHEHVVSLLNHGMIEVFFKLLKSPY